MLSNETLGKLLFQPLITETSHKAVVLNNEWQSNLEILLEEVQK